MQPIIGPGSKRIAIELDLRPSQVMVLPPEIEAPIAMLIRAILMEYEAIGDDDLIKTSLVKEGAKLRLEFCGDKRSELEAALSAAKPN